MGSTGPVGPSGEKGRRGVEGRRGGPGEAGVPADKGQKGDRGFSGFAGLKGQKGEPGGRSPSYRVAFSVARSQKLGPVLQASCFMHLNRFLESTLGWCRDCDSYTSVL